MPEEKLLHEVRIVETEEGYRIDIKGDKERLKQMFSKGFPFGRMAGFGRGFGPGRHGDHGHHGPFGWGRRGPWGGWYDDDETERSDKEKTDA